MNGAVLQQVFIVEFVVHNQMCEDCHRVEAKDYWRACVQIRQKVLFLFLWYLAVTDVFVFQTTHKKTLFYLEQLMLMHGAHANSTSIKQVHGEQPLESISHIHIHVLCRWSGFLLRCSTGCQETSRLPLVCCSLQVWRFSISDA